MISRGKYCIELDYYNSVINWDSIFDWLIKNIGLQEKSWSYLDYYYDADNLIFPSDQIQFYFHSKSHAILFELTWL